MSDNQENRDDSSNKRPVSSDRDVAGSPGNQSNSSTRRPNRVVELLQDADYGGIQPADWVISQEFYDENIVAGNLSGESSDDNDHYYVEDFQAISEDGEDDDDDDDLDRYEDDDDDTDPGFVMVPDNGLQYTSSEDTDEDSNQAVDYDRTLPTNHSYLGENLEESRGRQVLVEDSITKLPLINISHVVLFPGQILPVSTIGANIRIQNHLEDCVTRGTTTIGLMSNPHINRLGTTAEIRNYLMQEDSPLNLILEGRQRFELLSAPFEFATFGEIKILPEITLGRPYHRISSCKRFFTSHDTPSKFIISKHPHWLLKRYEAHSLMERLMVHVKDWCSINLTNPADFSYWLASNLPMSDGERMEALSFGCTEARLLWLLDKLEKSDVFCCAVCENEICSKKDIFAMSCTGPQCSFVNEGGYIHDTFTVRRAGGIKQEHGRNSKYSWFPGYAWRIARCDNCGIHLGWCFMIIERVGRPRRFFGLSRGKVCLRQAPVKTISEQDQPQPGRQHFYYYNYHYQRPLQMVPIHLVNNRNQSNHRWPAGLNAVEVEEEDDDADDEW